MQAGTAHKAPGLGRKNRKQRLLEYAERRSALLLASGHRKRRRRPAMGALDARGGNGDGEEQQEAEPYGELYYDDADADERERAAARMTIVFAGGAGAEPGYVARSVLPSSSACVDLAGLPPQVRIRPRGLACGALPAARHPARARGAP